jgi:hypothetical protein
LADEFGFTLHLRSRGEEAWAKRHAGATARRWVVERTHSWLNRFRSILIRWAKKPANYLALLHFALAIITWRHALPGYVLILQLSLEVRRRAVVALFPVTDLGEGLMQASPQ